MNRIRSRYYFAFTIVELLVVIVVIGILAAISIVSYGGISKRANLASLQSDLSNAANKLKAYQTIYGSYPTLDGNNCPSAPTVDSNYCLKFSPNNSIATTPFAGYIPNNSTTPKTFSLTLSSNGIQGIITESSKPSILTSAPLNPVADWIATPQGDHYGNYYDPVSKSWANVTRSTPKTIYDPATQHIYDVPANYLAINPWSAYQPGGNGSAAVIEEARTNYITNSYGSINTGSGWSNGWSRVFPFCSGIPTWSITKGVYGETAQRIQYTGVSGDTAGQAQFAPPVVTGVFTAGENATGSFYIKGTASAGVTAYLYVQALSDSAYIATSSAPVTLDGQWRRVVVPYTNLPVGTTNIGTRLQVNGIVDGRSLDITVDAYQLEKGSFATSYIPTTTAVVARNNDNVQIPTTSWSYPELTLVATSAQSGYPGYATLIEASLSATERTQISRSLTNARIGATADSVAFTAAVSAVGSGITVGRFNIGQVPQIFFNSAGVAGASAIATTPDLPATAIIGTGGMSSNHYNGPIARATIYNVALSDSQVTSLNSLLDGP